MNVPMPWVTEYPASHYTRKEKKMSDKALQVVEMT